MRPVSPALLSLLLLPTAAHAELGPTPRLLDFGQTAAACPPGRGFVTVQNVGEAPVVITEVSLEGPDFVRLDPAPTLPDALGAREHAGFGVALSAPPTGPWQAELRITTTTETRTVRLSGTAHTGTEDEHVVVSEAPVDLLLYIDDAPSMRDEQLASRQNFAALGQFFRALGTDVNVAVITPRAAVDGLMRRLPGTNRYVVNARAPTFEQDLADLVDVGTGGDGARRGFDAIRRALSPQLLAGLNAGFVRPGSILSVIAVSDAEDTSKIPTHDFISFLQEQRGFWQTHRVSMSSIVGDRNTGCAGYGGIAGPGRRYIEAANQTGGVFQSICTADWSRSLEDLSTLAFGFKALFRLRSPAIPETLRVFDDLEFVPPTSAGGTVNWTYDDRHPLISFSPFGSPAPASRVRIEYTPRCHVARPIY